MKTQSSLLQPQYNALRMASVADARHQDKTCDLLPRFSTRGGAQSLAHKQSNLLLLFVSKPCLCASDCATLHSHLNGRN